MAGLQVVNKTYRHTQRYLEILRVLSRYGFYDLISESGFDLLGPLGRKISLKGPEGSVLKLSRWERMRLALEELGPTYIKFGQILSTRGDLEHSNLVNIVDEFDHSIHRELSFSTEASSIERFGNNLRNDPTVYVPQCYRKYSTGKLLTLEFIEGVKISELEKFGELDLDPRLIAQRGIDLELRQIFEHGFFHADPHPGNLLVLPENVICFLDFGMMGTLTRSTRELIVSMALGAINRDYDKITRNILKICETTGEVNMRQLEVQVTELVDLYFHQSLENIDMKELFTALVDFFPRNRLFMPADLYALGRALVLLQGDGEILYPEFNIANQVAPNFKKLVRKRFRPQQYARELAISSEEMLRLAGEMPGELRDLMEKAREGNWSNGPGILATLLHYEAWQNIICSS